MLDFVAPKIVANFFFSLCARVLLFRQLYKPLLLYSCYKGINRFLCVLLWLCCVVSSLSKVAGMVIVTVALQWAPHVTFIKVIGCNLDTIINDRISQITNFNTIPGY